MSIEKAFLEVYAVMKRLRDPGGCPWDQEQTHQSIIPYLIEEAHETQEALADGDWTEFKTELGDILCQVIFHSLIASEDGRFTIEDVCQTLKEKLIRRHPHVFEDVSVSGSDEVLKNWEKIKKKEKQGEAGEPIKSILSGVPKTLPALLRSYRIGQKVSRVGFEFPSIRDALAKVREEFDELQAEIESTEIKNDHKLAHELGDLFFSLVNVARRLKINPEEALLTTTRRFQKRFLYIEQELHKLGRSIEEASLEEMDDLWEEAKRVKSEE